MPLLENNLQLFVKRLLQKPVHSGTMRTHELRSKHLKRRVQVDVYLPEDYSLRPRKRYPAVFFNDGQDMKAVGLQQTVQQLTQKGTIPSIIAIAIHANENRMAEYGTASQPDYNGRGAKAKAYTNFVMQELLHFVNRKYRLHTNAAQLAFAGFSLGGLSAMDIVWHHPNNFGKVGVFSGSFWWRYKAFKKTAPDADRIMHHILHHSIKRAGLKFWLQTGTNDEASDRNENGIIDSIDDTLDIIRELKRLGYQEQQDIRYVEVEEGEHNPQTWGKVLPDFLTWAFAEK